MSAAPKNVGTYTVIAKFPGSTSYSTATSEPATFIIEAVDPPSTVKKALAAVHDAAILKLFP